MCMAAAKRIDKIVVYDKDRVFYNEVLCPVLPFLLKEYCPKIYQDWVKTKPPIIFKFNSEFKENIEDTEFVIIDHAIWDDHVKNDNVMVIGYDVPNNKGFINKNKIFNLFFQKIREKALTLYSP